jgi:hypothetical protein
MLIGPIVTPTRGVIGLRQVLQPVRKFHSSISASVRILTRSWP